MRILTLLMLVCIAAPVSAGELCFANDPFGGYYCCLGFPPCDFFAPLEWVGFRTDAAPCQDHPQDWYTTVTLSTSLHNPNLNSGPIPAHGRLYLWLLADGWDGDGFSIYVAGDIPIFAYEPIAPGPNSYDPSTGLIKYDGCGSPSVVGAFVVGPGTIAVEGETWGQTKAVYR